MYPMETQITKESTCRFSDRTYRHNHTAEVYSTVALSEAQKKIRTKYSFSLPMPFIIFHLKSPNYIKTVGRLSNSSNG